MKRRTLAALAMLALTVAAGAKDKAMNGVSEQVQVESQGGKVLVTLTLDNRGARAVQVPKMVYEDDELFGPAFEITDLASGAPVDYIGPKVKRGPFTKDDYIVVKPGTKRSHRIDITRSYDFRAGTHGYMLKYPAEFLVSVADQETAGTHSVSPVTFTHTAK